MAHDLIRPSYGLTVDPIYVRRFNQVGRCFTTVVYERYENYPTASVSVTASDGTVAGKRRGFHGATIETKYRIRLDFIDRPITEDPIHKEFSLGLLFPSSSGHEPTNHCRKSRA